MEFEERAKREQQALSLSLQSAALLQLPTVYEFNQLLPQSNLIPISESGAYSFVTPIYEESQTNQRYFYSCTLPEFTREKDVI